VSGNSTERSRTSRARSKNRGRPLTSTERSRLSRARAKAAQDPVKTFLQTLVDSVLLAGEGTKLSADDDRLASMAQDMLDDLSMRQGEAADLSGLWFVFGATTAEEKAFIRELNEDAFEGACASLVAQSPETAQTVAVQLATRTLTRAAKALAEGSATLRDKTAGIRSCKTLIAERTSVTATDLYVEWTTVKATLAWFQHLDGPQTRELPTELSDGSFNTPLDPMEFYGVAS
jgi:hypothetical protein